jgi:outer membrane autotransporter protein
MTAVHVLRSMGFVIGIALALLSTGANAKRDCGQGGNQKDGECLVFLGKARVEDSNGNTVAQRSFWMSSNIFDNTNSFYLEAAQWSSGTFDLAPGGLLVSMSPIVSSGGGGTHRLYLTGKSPDCGQNNGCNIDSQNQQDGFDVVVRPPPPIEPPLIEPPPVQPPPVQPPPVQPPPVQPPPIEPPPIEPPPIEPPPLVPPPVDPPPIEPPPGAGGGNGRGNLIDKVVGTLRDNGIMTMLNRSYSISDRMVSGLAARRHLGMRGLDMAFEPVMLAAATTDVPLGPLGITPYRDLGSEDAEWSVWLDGGYLSISDERYGLSTDGSSRGIILGFDRMVDDGLVVGIALGTDDAEITGYGGTVGVDYRGYFGGPYVGYRINDELVLDAWLAYGSYDVDSRISVLEGRNDFDRWFSSVNLTGQYVYDEYRFRPKLSLFYAHSDADDPRYRVRGIPEFEGETFVFAGEDENQGLVDVSLEVNRLWSVSDDLLVLPYGRAGIRYDFDRPNDGELVTPTLELVTPSAWSGNLRLGVKALVNKNMIVDVSGGYLSLGQNGLDVWNGRLAVSWLF